MNLGDVPFKKLMHAKAYPRDRGDGLPQIRMAQNYHTISFPLGLSADEWLEMLEPGSLGFLSTVNVSDYVARATYREVSVGLRNCQERIWRVVRNRMLDLESEVQASPIVRTRRQLSSAKTPPASQNLSISAAFSMPLRRNTPVANASMPARADSTQGSTVSVLHRRTHQPLIFPQTRVTLPAGITMRQAIERTGTGLGGAPLSMNNVKWEDWKAALDSGDLDRCKSAWLRPVIDNLFATFISGLSGALGKSDGWGRGYRQAAEHVIALAHAREAKSQCEK